MEFLNSAPAQYAVQTFFHSLIAAFVILLLLRIWHISQPQLRLKFFLMVWLLPVFTLPLYYLSYSERYSLEFHRNTAIFDTSQWLGLRIAGIYPLTYFLALLMAATAFLFLIQEVMPALRSRFSASHRLQPLQQGQFPKLDSALERLKGALGQPLPPLFLATEEEPVIYASGTSNPSIVLSASLIDILEEEELEAVLAHEIAHLLKGDQRLGWVFLALRTLVFYNPVALIASRHSLRENEKICDDLAIYLVPNRAALAAGLLKVYRGGSSSSPHHSTHLQANRFSTHLNALESRAGKAMLKERLERLLDPEKEREVPLSDLRLAVTALSLALLLFFVV